MEHGKKSVSFSVSGHSLNLEKTSFCVFADANCHSQELNVDAAFGQLSDTV